MNIPTTLAKLLNRALYHSGKVVALGPDGPGSSDEHEVNAFISRYVDIARRYKRETAVGELRYERAEVMRGYHVFHPVTRSLAADASRSS